MAIFNLDYYNEGGAHQKYSQQLHKKSQDQEDEARSMRKAAIAKENNKKFWQKSTFNDDLANVRKKRKESDDTYAKADHYDTKTNNQHMADKFNKEAEEENFPGRMEGKTNKELAGIKSEFQRKYGSAAPKNKALHDKINARSAAGCSCRESFVTEEAYMNFFCEANFSFIPKFKEEPELKDLYLACKNAEYLLNSKGVSVDAGGEKFGKTALRILDVLASVGFYSNAGNALAQGENLLIYLVSMLLGRLWSWAYNAGQEATAESYTRKCIAKYDYLIGNTKDRKIKKELEEAKGKLIDKYQKLQATKGK